MGVVYRRQKTNYYLTGQSVHEVIASVLAWRVLMLCRFCWCKSNYYANRMSAGFLWSPIIARAMGTVVCFLLCVLSDVLQL